MFFSSRTETEKTTYIEYLRMIGSLSRLFSESDVPYLYYRASEQIFCKSFNAENYSRKDSSFDAGKLVGNRKFGIGIKTFLEQNGCSYQKVAEFNKAKKSYINLLNSPKELVSKISELRNQRLTVAKNIYQSDEEIYHCVLRSKNIFTIYESSMDFVNIDGIKSVKLKPSENVIDFEDGINAYKFNLTKSTLLKKFDSTTADIKFPVEILEDPYKHLHSVIKSEIFLHSQEVILSRKPFVVLPLFSTSSRQVPEKSQLNHWNASGRKRNLGEVYIHVPSKIHRYFPEFFPDIETPFDLILPHGERLKAKMCQAGRKGLMSNPNNALAQWLLRDVLALEEGELLTYDKLLEIGIDSVSVTKLNSSEFKIDFMKSGSFDIFYEKYLAGKSYHNKSIF